MNGHIGSDGEMKEKSRQVLEYLKDVFTSNDANTIQDLEGNITAWNAGAVKTYGYSEIEALKMNVADLVPEEYKAEALNFIISLKKDELVESLETKRLTKDGKILDVWMVVTRLVDEDGKLIGAATSERDITKRKQPENEILEMTQSLTLVNSVNEAINRGESLENIFDLVSKKTRELFSSSGAHIHLLGDDRQQLLMQGWGYPPSIKKMVEKLIGRNIPELSIPLTSESIYTKILEAGEPVLYNDVPTIEKLVKEYIINVAQPGTRRYQVISKLIPKIVQIMGLQSIIVIPLIGETNKLGILDVSRKEPFTNTDLERLHNIAEQITSAIVRKKNEEEIRKSKQRIEMLVTSSTSMIYACEAFGDFDATFVSDNIFTITGYTVEEFLTKGFWANHIHPEDAPKVFENLGKLFKHGHHSHEYRFGLRDGTYFWMVDELKLVKDKNGNPLEIIGTWSNITERKQAEKALAESNSLRELLLDIITHDLKNPAGVIYALSEAALKNMPENKFMEVIYTSSGRLIEVLNQTTILSQATFGETIPKETLSLNKLLQKTVDEYASELSTAEMECVVVIAPDLIIEANPLIGEVFKNYISNAIKYAKDGKRIVIETAIEDQSVVVRVKDFGKTIAEADRDQIFERQVQLENGKERGRGLGLAIVKRIAGAHDGEVWVEPITPVGNSFCLRIPHLK